VELATVLRPAGFQFALTASGESSGGSFASGEFRGSQLRRQRIPRNGAQLLRRFLDEASINELFSVGWRRLSLEHLTIHKYRMPKAVWELVVERDA
jgi:hypothetical protein